MSLTRRIVLGFGAFIALLLAATRVVEPEFPLAGVSLLRLRSAAGIAMLLTRITMWCSWEILRVVPLAVMSVLLVRELRSPPATKVGRLAFAGGLAVLTASLYVRNAFAAPNPLEVPFAIVGLGLGVLFARAWLEGAGAVRGIVVKLAAAAAGLVGLVLLLGLLAIEGAPRLPETAPITSDQRRELVRLVRGKDPRKIPPGEVRTLSLTGEQLDHLARWAGTVGLDARATIKLRSGGASAAMSLRIPGTSRWLNADASANLTVRNGAVDVREPVLGVGRLGIPSPLLSLLCEVALALLRSNDATGNVIAAITDLSFAADQASLTYRHFDLPSGLAARVIWGDELIENMRERVGASVDALLAELPTVPEGDERFARALQIAFSVAGEQARSGGAVEANRAALLALGVVLGHHKLTRAFGERYPLERVQQIIRLRDGTTLRGRQDWTRHFAVSLALTVLSDVAPSDAVGLLKEELDADGGSGFSFADLLADRSGTTLAQRATRDEASARSAQQRLSRPLRVDDFFPPADGLPEGIPDAEFKAKYGGVGGAQYNALKDEIERRVAACAAYRD